MRKLEIAELPHSVIAQSRDHLLAFVLSCTRDFFRKQRSIAWHAYVVPRDAQKGVVLVTVEGDFKPPSGFVAHQEHSAWLEAGVRQIVIGLQAVAVYSVSENWVTDDLAYSAQNKRLVEESPNRRECVLVQQESAGEPPSAWVAMIERNQGRPHLLEWRASSKPPQGRLTGFLSARPASERPQPDLRFYRRGN